MSKNRIVLFGVLGVVVGLALGVFGRDFIVANERQKIEAQKAEEAVATSIIVRLEQASTDLSMFRMKNSKEIGENYDLGAALNTPERIREKLGDIYADGRWVFQSNAAGWWIGYKLDGVSDAVRQKIASQARFSNLFKATDKSDANVYDGGDIVFLYDYVPKTFKW